MPEKVERSGMSVLAFLREHGASLSLFLLTVVWATMAWDTFDSAGELTTLAAANVCMAAISAGAAVYAAYDERAAVGV